MPRMSFGVGSSANLSSVVDDPRAGHRAGPQMQSWMRRRLEDSVEDIFHVALQRGDLASAEDLLGVMENMQARAKVRYNSDRRGTAMMIERCRTELAERKSRRRFGAR
jgi:hypothetical protein